MSGCSSKINNSNTSVNTSDKNRSVLAKANGLKTIRRQLGLSQIDLADLLKVSQSNISRWENGYEQFPLRMRNALLNAMSNQKGELNPILKRMVKTDPSLSLFQPEQSAGHVDSRWLHYSPRLAHYFQLQESEISMARSSQFFDPFWRPHIHNAGLLEDRVMIQFERDYIATGGPLAGRSCRLLSNQYVVEFEGYSNVTVSTSSILGAATGQGPMIHTLIRRSDLAKPKRFFKPPTPRRIVIDTVPTTSIDSPAVGNRSSKWNLVGEIAYG